MQNTTLPYVTRTLQHCIANLIVSFDSQHNCVLNITALLPQIPHFDSIKQRPGRLHCTEYSALLCTEHSTVLFTEHSTVLFIVQSGVLFIAHSVVLCTALSLVLLIPHCPLCCSMYAEKVEMGGG